MIVGVGSLGDIVKVGRPFQEFKVGSLIYAMALQFIARWHVGGTLGGSGILGF